MESLLDESPTTDSLSLSHESLTNGSPSSGSLSSLQDEPPANDSFSHESPTNDGSPRNGSPPRDGSFSHRSTNNGRKGTARWPRPLCLIENIDGTMKLNGDTVAKLQAVKEPLVVVSVVGLYRTGKSYLMNRLAGSLTGFDLGNTVQAKTKGIWIWCVIHPTRRDHRLLLMDTEGLGDIERGDTQFDTMLFVTAALLSSTLVYNSKGTIDYDAIDKLHVVTELADKIKIKKNENPTDDGEIRQHLPKFVWAIRDFHLELEVDGRVLSADQYLDEHALKKKKGTGRRIHDLNRTLDCIKGYFAIRKCFPFPPPVSHSKMSMLDKLSNDDLSRTFRERSKEFCDYIYNESLTKCIAGVVLDGQKLASIAQHYIETMLAGGVPCMESAYLATANTVNRAAFVECVTHYEKGMSTLALPTPDEQALRTQNTRCSEEATALFSQKIMAVYESEKLTKELSDAISSKYQAIVEHNEQESERKCRKAAQKLFQPIQTKIDAGSYSNIGGYSQFRQEVEAAYRAYQEMPGKGVKALHVQQEYVTKYSELGTVIMVADKALSDKEKMQEEERQKQLVLAGQVDKLKAEKEYSDRLRADQEKRQQEFQVAMQAQMAQQARTHADHIARMEQQSRTYQQQIDQQRIASQKQIDQQSQQNKACLEQQSRTYQAQINQLTELLKQQPKETIIYRQESSGGGCVLM